MTFNLDNTAINNTPSDWTQSESSSPVSPLSSGYFHSPDFVDLDLDLTNIPVDAAPCETSHQFLNGTNQKRPLVTQQELLNLQAVLGTTP